MDDMVARLVLDAEKYVAQINAVGKETEEKLASAGQRAGTAMGKGVAAGGVDAKGAMDGVSTHAKTTVDKIGQAFGHVRWEHLVGAFALIHIGLEEAKAAWDAMVAYSELKAASSVQEVIKAQEEILSAGIKALTAIPVIGGFFAMGLTAEKAAYEQELRWFDGFEKRTEEMEKTAVRLHEEAILAKMRADGRSEEEIKAMRNKFAADKETTELERAERALNADEWKVTGQVAHLQGMLGAGKVGEVPTGAEEMQKFVTTIINYHDRLGDTLSKKQDAERFKVLTELATLAREEKAVAAAESDAASKAGSDAQTAAQKEAAEDEKSIAAMEKREEKEGAIIGKRIANLNAFALAEERVAAMMAARTAALAPSFPQPAGVDSAHAQRPDRGGYIEMAEGGYVQGPSGIDTVPAWLTAGEFVVNSAAARRNASWLSAINDGVTLPASAGRYASGGSVQASAPVHVTANITVNPPPGANPRDIARSVVEELARLKIRGRG